MVGKFIAGSALSVLLMGAPLVALAHDGGQNAGFHLGAFLNTQLGIGHRDNDGDADDATTTAKADVRAQVHAGTVGSITGSVFTILGHGKKGATTTVTTDANTKFVTKGGATTSAALTQGAHVIVIGTTTATSTSGDTVLASVVAIIGKGFGHLGAWFHLHAH